MVEASAGSRPLLMIRKANDIRHLAARWMRSENLSSPLSAYYDKPIAGFPANW